MYFLYFKIYTSEYVEWFVMPPEIKNISIRSARWKNFLNETKVGKDIRDCILKSNPGWKTVDMIAEKFSAGYSMASDPEHARSHEIHENKDILLKIATRAGPQMFNAMACIGDVLQLRITRGD